MSLYHVVLLGVAGFFGTIVRYCLVYMLAPSFSISVFVSLIMVNALSSGLLGAVLGLKDSGLVSQGAFMIVSIGFCGAFSTFSTVILDSIMLFRSSQYISLGLYFSAQFFVSCTAFIVMQWAVIDIVKRFT